MKKQIITFVALLLAVLLLLPGCSVGQSGSIGVIDAVKPAAQAENGALGVFGGEKKDLLRVSQSGMTGLYFDETTYSICVYDTAAKKLWRSLPANDGGGTGSVLTLSVICGNEEHILSSQNDSAALGGASYELSENGISITYRFRKKLGETDVNITVPVNFFVEDGKLSVNIDCAEISVSDGVVVTELSLLPFFGADRDGGEGDFLFVPDGCGAVIDISKRPTAFKSLSLPVYGGDASITQKKQAVYIPAFGKKRGDSAFVALVEDGDAIASINAEKALEKSGLDRVWARFELTGSATEGEKTFLSAESYDGNLSVCYRLLSGDNATYTAMASACREQLVRSSVLSFSERSVSQNEGLPFELGIINSAKLDLSATQRTLTTLSEAKDIVSLFRSKGIKNISVKLRGVFEGGSVQKNFSSVRLFSPVGNKSDLTEFMEFATSQNISVYAEAALFSAQESENCAVALNREKALVQSEDLSETVFALSSAKKIEENASSLISSFRSYGFDGVCLFDAGEYLYSDNSRAENAGTQKIKERIASLCGALSVSKKLMLRGANIYAVKYASFVSSLPYTAKCAKRELCTAVPFLQTVLHGYVDYSHTAFNRAKNSETAFLKAVEYGAVPSGEWYFADRGSEESKDRLYYMNTAAEAQQYYERMNEAFADLRDKKITAHKEVKSGVFRTEYGSSVSIYVNYNKKDVTVDGVTVEGRSFIRV